MSTRKLSLRDSVIISTIITILFIALSKIFTPQASVKVRQIFPLFICIAIVIACIGYPVSSYVRRNLAPEFNRRNFIWYSLLGFVLGFLLIFIPVAGFGGLYSGARLDWVIFIICFALAGALMGGLSVCNNKDPHQMQNKIE